MTTEGKVKIEIPRCHSPQQESFVRSTAKRQVIKAGRRFGKTVGAAIKVLLAFLGTCIACEGVGCEQCEMTGKARPKRVLYAAPTSEQVSKFWYEVNRALEGMIQSKVLRKNETEKYIEVLGTEQRIKAKTAWNANTLRGDYADLLILEEYQLMNEDAWTEVGHPMLLDNNGDAVFIFTPPSLRDEGISKAKDPRHASKLFKMAEQDASGKWQTFHFTSFENPTLSREALAEISKDMSQDAYRREILAEDEEIETSWLVYGKFNERLCKLERFDIPESWPLYSGHDFGTANPAALFVAEVKFPIPDGLPSHLRYGDYIVFSEYCPGGGLSIKQHIDNFKTIAGRSVYSVGGNVTTEEEIRQGYTSEGWPIYAPSLKHVSNQIERVIALMERNQLYIFNDLYRLLGQIANCMWVVDEEKRPTNKIKNESRYHLLACLRYVATVLETVSKPQGEAEMYVRGKLIGGL